MGCTREQIATLLPLLPRAGMTGAVAEHCTEELGPNICTYRRVSSAEWDCGDIGWPSFDEPRQKPRWSAECTCGVCGTVFHGGWRKDGKGVALTMGEDGALYSGIPKWGMEYSEGDEIECLYCGEAVRLLPKKALSHGRTYRVRVGSLENVGPYTAVVSWMAERWICSDGSAHLTLGPEAAAVIDGSGALMLYRRADGKWTPKRGTDDPFQSIYLSYDGSMGRKVGAWLWPDVPEQRGQTGEKTGIGDYFRGGGQWPVLYLRFWRIYPNVENLVKAGWLRPLEQSIDSEVLAVLRNASYTGKRKLHAPFDIRCLADWNAVRPCDMLGMTRQEVRDGVRWRWDDAMLGLWVGCVSDGIAAPGDAAFLEECRKRYGLGALQHWADMAGEGNVPADLMAINRYLLKQHQKRELPIGAALTMYLDYWEMLGEDHPTPEQIFPPNLQAAHDRAMANRAAEDDAKYIKGFMRMRQQWHELEWSDGRICAVLPRTNSELVAEGKTLHHCVGGYGPQHTAGKIIVFIRHARRPERSWYTLNIDTTRNQWAEIQLHGYHNEWVGGKRLSIPREVREFVDRWEREVLTPVFRKVRRQQKEGGAA